MASPPANPTNAAYDRLARSARRVWAAAFVAIAMLALAASISAKRYVDALWWVEHTRQVDSFLERTHADLLEAGYGARGYVITGEESFLAPFHRARHELPRDLAELRRLTADNPRQRSRLERIESLIGERLRLADEIVALRRAGNTVEAFDHVRSGRGRYAADGARALIDVMRAEEGALLSARHHVRRRAEITTGAIVVVVIALLLIAAVAGSLRFPRMVRELGLAQHELHVNRELYRILLKGLPDAVALLFNRDMRFVVVEGDQVLASLGVKKGSLVGASVVDVTTPANRALVERAYREALEGERSSFELSSGGRDLLVSVSPVRDDSGAVVAGLALARDVTEQKCTAAELEAERATLRAVLDSMQDAVLVTDSAGRVSLMNPAARDALGDPAPDRTPPGARSGRMFLPDNETRLPVESSPLARALRGERVDGAEIVIRTPLHPQGRWHSINATPVRGDGGAVRGAVCVGRDVTEERRAREALRQLSTQDELTGLLNRRGFLALAAERAEASADAKRPFALVFVDLNGMKKINDQLGHEAGDRALVDAASVLQKTFREGALVARLGGDEFVVFVPGVDGHGAQHLVERLQANVARHNQAGGRDFRLSLSAGVAPFDPARPETVECLLERADEQMYHHKRTRKRSEPPPRDRDPNESPLSRGLRFKTSSPPAMIG